MPEVTEVTAVALLLLGEWCGLDEQAQAMAKPSKLSSKTLGEIVGRYGGSSYLLLLLRALDFEGVQALGACIGLGYLGDPRVVPRLIELTSERNRKMAEAASHALEVLSGHYESTEESLLRSRWQAWWDKEGHRFKVGQRYRNGRLMSPQLLIERLEHDDLLVRRACYDELVISTGVHLPFDADGPWRVQESHIQGWKAWWREKGRTLPKGSWLFHGEIIN